MPTDNHPSQSSDSTTTSKPSPISDSLYNALFAVILFSTFFGLLFIFLNFIVIRFIESGIPRWLMILLGVVIVISLSSCLLQLREENRLIYGYVEFGFAFASALITIFYIFKEHGVDLNKWIALAGVIYFMVQSMDNIDVGRKAKPNKLTEAVVSRDFFISRRRRD
jgi:hypothetical protein